jgi:CDP-diacylglycerol--serine O-phosphatidyltransferase
VHFLKKPLLQVGSALLWYFLVTILAFLMISTVRYYSGKEVDVKKSRPRWTFLAAGALLWSIIFYSEYVLLTLGIAYVSAGPVAKLVQMVRRFLAPHAASSEPAHDNIRN